MPAEQDPAALVRYVWTLGAIGLLLVGGWLSVADPADVDGGVVAVLAMLAVGAAALPLRLHRRGGIQAFTLDESVLIAMLFLLPAELVVPLTVATGLVGHGLVGRDRLKLAFNVGQSALYASVAVVVFHAIAAGSGPLTGRGVLGAIAAKVVIDVVSTGAMAELFRRLEGHPYASSVAQTWRLTATTSLGNLGLGLIIAVLVMDRAVAGLLAAVIMVGLALGYRGYAGVVDERQRTQRLQAVTRTLVDAMASEEATTAFLEQLQTLFGARASELVIADRTVHRQISRHGAEVTVHDDAVDDDGPLGEALRCRGTVRANAGQGPLGTVLERRGHRDAIAAPLVSQGRCVGALAIYDRRGLEPWDDSDATLLATLANEATVALRNVQLFREVEQERSRLAVESRKLSDIVNAASDGIAMLHHDGTIAAWNPRMEVISGLERNSAIGRPWFVVLRLRDQERTDLLADGTSALHRGLAGELLEDPVDLQILRRDGQWRWIRVSISPVQPGEQNSAVVLVVRDVTGEREVEGLKADFVATVSHELRTPLTPIKGFLATLQARRDQLPDEQVGLLLDSMATQVGRLEALVADLLVVADLESGGIPLESDLVELGDCTADALAATPDPTGRVRRGRWDHVDVVADRSALARAVHALVNNAIKHTDGEVVVEVRAEADAAVVTVTDEGPGIPVWEQERIFERFHRLGDHLTRTQGPGLGLPIARALARRLGGDITVDADAGRGSTFELRLPVEQPRPVATSGATGLREGG